MLSRFIFKQIIAPDLFLQIIDSDDFLFANCLFRSLSVTHFVNCHQGRRVASILERRCGSEDESRTIWPHAFHIWSCSEASIRRFWGIKVFSFVKWTCLNIVWHWWFQLNNSGQVVHRGRQPKELPVFSNQGKLGMEGIWFLPFSFFQVEWSYWRLCSGLSDLRWNWIQIWTEISQI